MPAGWRLWMPAHRSIEADPAEQIAEKEHEQKYFFMYPEDLNIGNYSYVEKEETMTRSQLSRFCFTAALFTVLSAIPAVAISAAPAGQRPCAEEIEKFCKDVCPGEGRMLKCLQDHDSELSAVCRDKIKASERRMEEAKQTCAKEIEKFCAGVKPGGGRLIKCLRPHLEELSPACREKFEPFKTWCDTGKKPVRKQ